MNLFRNSCRIGPSPWPPGRPRRGFGGGPDSGATPPGVVCIPKSVHAERIAENFDVFGFALDAEDMAVIASLDRPESSFLDHRDPETVEWLSNLH